MNSYRWYLSTDLCPDCGKYVNHAIDKAADILAAESCSSPYCPWRIVYVEGFLDHMEAGRANPKMALAMLMVALAIVIISQLLPAPLPGDHLLSGTWLVNGCLVEFDRLEDGGISGGAPLVYGEVCSGVAITLVPLEGGGWYARYIVDDILYDGGVLVLQDKIRSIDGLITGWRILENE